MRICDLQTGSLQLTRAVKGLREAWLESAEHWQDGNRKVFERDHLEPLPPQVRLLLAGVQRLADVLEDAERECRDDDELSELEA